MTQMFNEWFMIGCFNKQVAIKIVDKSQLDAANLRKLYREVQILKMLKHDNIIRLYQVRILSQLAFIIHLFIGEPMSNFITVVSRSGLIYWCYFKRTF